MMGGVAISGGFDCMEVMSCVYIRRLVDGSARPV